MGRAHKLGKDTLNADFLPSAAADPRRRDGAGLLVWVGRRAAGAPRYAPAVSGPADAAARLHAGNGDGLLVCVDSQRAGTGAPGAVAGSRRAECAGLAAVRPAAD